MTENITKQQIIIATAELLAQSGYTTTSMQQIADKVGITKAALYYHFKNKEAVIREIFDEDYLKIKTDIEAIINSKKTDYKKLEDLINRLIETKTKNPEMQLLSHVGNSPMDKREIASYVRTYKKKFFGLLRSSLKKICLFSHHSVFLDLTETLIMGIILSAVVHSKTRAQQITKTFVNFLQHTEEIHACK